MIFDIHRVICFPTGKQILFLRAIQQEQIEFGFADVRKIGFYIL